MAIFMKACDVIRKLIISMNLLIVCAMAYGFYLFLSQDGMFDGWEWAYYLPIYSALFIGLPVLMCMSLFKNSSTSLKVVFLALNLVASTILLGSLFVNSWVMAGPEMSFSWRSYIKLCTILVTPFALNAMTLSLLFFQKTYTQRP